MQVLQLLAKEKDPHQLANVLPEILCMLYKRISALQDRNVPVEELFVTQTLSRELVEYRVPSQAARAASQLQSIGKNIQMGQRIQFIYVKTKQGVWARGLPDPFHPGGIDIAKYKELLFRAVYEVLQPLGVGEGILRNWMFRRASYLLPPGLLHPRLEMPLFADLKHVRVEIV